MAQAAATQDTLLQTLRDFHARVKASAPVKKLIARWDRLVEVRSVTFPRRSYFMRSLNGEMLEPTTEAPGEPDIAIVADGDVLEGIFNGELNPARAHLDGRLQAVGAQKDQLVLDSIVLLIWGY